MIACSPSSPLSPSRAFSARPLDDRNVVAGEVVGGKEFADFQLDQFEELFVVDHVGLVQKHDDVGNADLTGKQDVLAGLGHRTVGCGHDQDRAVHLRRSGDHVLDVVGMARAVHVRIVTFVGLVLDVGGGDGDAALALFRSVVDLVERLELGLSLAGQDLGDRRRQRRLAVVNVTNRPYVYVRFLSFEFCLCHVGFLPGFTLIVELTSHV